MLIIIWFIEHIIILIFKSQRVIYILERLI